MFKLKNFSVKIKLNLIVVAALAILFCVNAYYLYSENETLLSERKGKLQSQVESSLSIARHFYSQSAELGETKAKQLAINAIQGMRYDTGNYFWITSPEQKIIMHPTKPSLNGQDVSKKTDTRGYHYWREMSEIGKHEGKGFLEYYWNSPQGIEQHKLSYVISMPEWGWIIGSGLLISDIDDGLEKNTLVAGLTTLLCTVSLIGLSYIIGFNIITPIEGLIGRLYQIADGDMKGRINDDRQDEIGIMGKELDRMLNKLQTTLLLANQSASNSANMANQIASSSEESATSIQSQHKQLELLSTAMSEMTATITDVARNADHASNSTNEVTLQARDSRDDMQKTADDIHHVSKQVAHADDLVEELKDGVISIGVVVEEINAISEQTNLLALNAAIEAARAGEQGRGFSVVADEVRNLANRTQASTTQIQDTIDTLKATAMRASEAMQGSNNHVLNSVESVSGTQEKLDKMLEELNLSNDMVAQIAAAAEQQGTVSDEVNINVSSINLSANEVSQSADNLAHQSQSLSEMAQELDEQLKYFDV